MLTIHTIGHSIRALDDFIALLQQHGIHQLADIRSIPKSRRHPQFCDDVLACALAEHRITYRHFPDLGGKRAIQANSLNHAAPRGLQAYADYMASPTFERALERLMEWATATPTAMMCAEAKPSECHRQLTADALHFRGVEVRHITNVEQPMLHQPHVHALWHAGKLSYPTKQGSLF